MQGSGCSTVRVVLGLSYDPTLKQPVLSALGGAHFTIGSPFSLMEVHTYHICIAYTS